MNGLRNFAALIGPRRVIAMAAVAAVLLLVLGAIALRGPSHEMGYLYTDLDPAGAQSITQKLTAQDIPFQISADGTAVMAPRERLAELRMSMASEQLGGKIGYEVLDQEEPFGVSSSRAKMNETRAIEGELSRSIESLDRVTKARVHIVMPERAMFAAESRKATAAITVKTQGALNGQAIEAIRYLVSSSVPELSPDSVSIVDQTGALLARAGESSGGGGSDIEERQAAIEGKLRTHIEAMVEPVVGQGKVRVEVAAVIDRTQTREEASVFDPDKQVVARQISVEAGDQSSENDTAAGVTVGAQLPESQGLPPAGDRERSRSAKNETSEDVTYENSRTNSVTIRAPGKINRLTVAVLVDGGAKGVPAAQLTRITRLVENAVGFDAERGDSVVVESIAFAAPVESETAADWLGELPLDRLWDLLKLALIAGVGLIAMRMLRQRRSTDQEPAAALAALPAPDAPEMAQLAARTAGGDEDGTLRIENTRADPALLDQEIALAQVDGRVKMSAIKRIGDAVAGSPGESASVVRQWMNA